MGFISLVDEIQFMLISSRHLHKVHSYHKFHWILVRALQLVPEKNKSEEWHPPQCTLYTVPPFYHVAICLATAMSRETNVSSCKCFICSHLEYSLKAPLYGLRS